MHRPLVVLGVAAFLALPSVARGQSTAQATSLSMESSGGTAGSGLLWRTWRSHLEAVRGDTIRIEAMIMNTTDSSVVLMVSPCGLQVSGVPGLRYLTPKGQCESRPQDMPPGAVLVDSVVAIVDSTPAGSYTITEFFGDGGGRTGFVVLDSLPPGRVRRPAARGMRTLRPYVLVIDTNSTNGITRQDLSSLVQYAAAAAQVAAFEIATGVPTFRPDLEYMRITFSYQADGSFKFAECVTRGVQGPDSACPPLSARSGGISSVLGLGAQLGDSLRRAFENWNVPDCPARVALKCDGVNR